MHDEMGTISEHTDEWNSVDQTWAAGIQFGGKWTDWTQFDIKGETIAADEPMQRSEPLTRKRRPDEFDDEEKQTEKALMLNDDEGEDAKMGFGNDWI